jgi:hypothetical protein
MQTVPPLFEVAELHKFSPNSIGHEYQAHFAARPAPDSRSLCRFLLLSKLRVLPAVLGTGVSETVVKN